MKKFYESKIFWAMALQFLISGLMIVQEWYAKGDFSLPGCIGLAISLLVIGLRVFFTDTAIDTPKAKAKLAQAEAVSQLERIRASEYQLEQDRRG